MPKYGRPVRIHSILRVGWGVLVDEAEALDDSVDERRAIGRLGTDEDVTQAVERRRWPNSTGVAGGGTLFAIQ